MRAIDADALIEKLDAEPEGGYYSPHDVISLLITQPTIEPKKGKWIWRTSDIYRCSECETDSHVAECMEEPIYNFCPYCGADMRGD